MEGEERRCGSMRLRDRTNPRTPFDFDEGALCCGLGQSKSVCLRLAGGFACVGRSLKSGSAENLDALGS
eukprot:scaffold61_cov434-Pavlova_lutheri.AAC.1